MVTRKMIQQTVIAGLFICALMAAPLYADEVATSFNSANNVLSLKGLVVKAVGLFGPMMESNRVTLVAADNSVLKGETKVIEERFVNLLSNALVHAPSGTEIKVSYVGNRLSLWVENEKVGYTIKREVVDSLGNTFILETESGKGTLYAINL